MSLETCSLILFFSTACLYLTVYLSIFRNPSVIKFLFLAFFWAFNVGATLWYGIYTGQIGFILIAGLEIAMAIFVYVTTGKAIQNDSN